MLQQPHAVPMQSEQLSHMLRGQAFIGLNDGLGQAARHAGIAIQPTDRFHAFAAVRGKRHVGATR
ncbi:hypothetical protein D3C76_1718870 [compost metagenome]